MLSSLCGRTAVPFDRYKSSRALPLPFAYPVGTKKLALSTPDTFPFDAAAPLSLSGQRGRSGRRRIHALAGCDVATLCCPLTRAAGLSQRETNMLRSDIELSGEGGREREETHVLGAVCALGRPPGPGHLQRSRAPVPYRTGLASRVPAHGQR